MIDARPDHFTIGGIEARTLAERFGTPLFVYDAETLQSTWRGVRACFDYEPTALHYAAVCNPNLHLLRLLRSEGASVHANTPGDVYCALRAGFERERVVLSGSNLGEEDLTYLDREGIYVNVDSMDDLARACAILHSREIGLRVHLEDVLPESRMGLRERELAGAMDLARSRGVRVTSLHVYCGTHGRCLDRYRAALARLVDIGSRMPDVTCLNVGGGFGYDYHEPEQHPFPFEALGAIAGTACKELSAVRGRPVLLRVEPGRAVVAGSGVLLTRVRSVKRVASRRYVGVDATTASFTSPVVHGAHRRVVAVEAHEPDGLPVDVCGCTTYSRDFVAQGSPLGAVRVDDLLAVLDVGAYGYCMSSHFLNRPKPAEVFVVAGEAKLVTTPDLRGSDGEPDRPPGMSPGASFPPSRVRRPGSVFALGPGVRTAVVTLFSAVLLVCCGSGGGRSEDKSLYAARAGCDGLDEFCEGGGLCCSGMFCGGANCCIAEGQTCHAAEDCCSGDCSGGRCSASPVGRWCDSSADCAAGLVCDIGPGFCRVPTGGHCRSANDCITATCLQGTCGCGSDADSCASDADCCPGLQCYGDGAVNGRNIGNFCR